MGFRLTSSVLVALVAGQAAAFVPHSVRTTTSIPAGSKSARYFGVDPSMFHDLPQHIQHMPDAFSSMTLSDAMEAVADAATSVAQPMADAATDAAQEVATSDNGWFGFLTEPIQILLQLIHSAFMGAGMSENSWGVSIVALTVLIKVVTFPLTKTQLESTNKMQVSYDKKHTGSLLTRRVLAFCFCCACLSWMLICSFAFLFYPLNCQALQPAIKELQAKYQSNPEVMNQKVADIYQQNEVNPLAGCLPSLVQIPVFIGLYRAVLDLAKENKLDESFLFLPNLEGPTYGADPAHGNDWLFQGWYVSNSGTEVCAVSQRF